MAALLAYVALGFAVSRQPPGAFDRSAHALLGHGLPLAVAGYRSGLFPSLATACVLAIAFAIFAAAWRGRVAFSVTALLLTWFISDRFKEFFARPRPENWLVVHETSASYSSGHAANSLVLYGLWSVYVWFSGAPRGVRIVLSGALLVWCLIVAWSRLAMGAHYPTDIIGGWLLGIAVVCGLRAATLVVEAKETSLE